MTRQQRYYQKHKERLLAKAREKYAENIIEEKIRSKKYTTQNRESIKIKRNIAMKLKRRNVPSFKLRSNVSRLIRKSLKLVNSGKRGLSFLKFVNYTMDDLKNHIQNLFEPWMNWNNWGVYSSRTWNETDKSTWTWQIDHVIPQSSLLYSSMEDDNFRKCWALSNLRPLSSKENFLKGSKNAVLAK